MLRKAPAQDLAKDGDSVSGDRDSGADRCQTRLLRRKAGADPEAIPRWVEVGRERAARAGLPPFSGGLHGGGRPGAPQP